MTKSKQVRRAAEWFLIFLTLLLSTGCLGSIKDRINEKYPRVTSVDQQKKALSQSLVQLGTIGDPNVYVRLDRSVLSSFFERELKQKAEEIKINKGKVQNGSLSNVKVTLKEKQGVLISTSFALRVTGLKGISHLDVEGELEGFVAVGTEGNKLMFHPAFDVLRVTKLKRGKLGSKKEKENFPLINKAISLFLDNLNGLIARKIPPIDIGLEKASPSLGPKDLMVKKGGVTIQGGKIHEIKFIMGQSAILVDEGGIQVLASLALGQKEATAAAETNLAMAEKLKGDLPKEEYQETVDTLFERYQTGFNEKLALFDEGIKGTGVRIRKGTVSQALNQALGFLNLKFTYEVPGMTLPFNSDIAVPAIKTKQNCDSHKKAFTGKPCERNCAQPGCGSCPGRPCGSCSGHSCDKGCGSRRCPRCKMGWPRRAKCELRRGGCIAACKAEEGACKVERAAKIAACQTKVAACKTKRELARIECQKNVAACKLKREKDRLHCQSKVATCKVKREIRRTAHQAKVATLVNTCKGVRRLIREINRMLDIGSVRGEVELVSGQVRGNVPKVSFSQSLSEFTLPINVSAGANFRTKVRFVPKDIGHFACMTGWDKTFTDSIKAELVTKSITASIKTRKQGDNLVMVLEIPETQIKGRLNTPPALRIFTDAELVFKCIGATALFASYGTFQFLKGESLPPKLAAALEGRFNHKIKPQTMEIPIAPMSIALGDRKISLSPHWGENTIGFDLSTN